MCAHDALILFDVVCGYVWLCVMVCGCEWLLFFVVCGYVGVRACAMRFEDWLLVD